MAAEPLQLTIDLALEIKNITEKQHLNDVHFAVQLVRHALRHGAPEVVVTSTKSELSVEHRGRSIDREEQDLLFVLLGEGPAAERQEAMTALEKRHGVGLLGLMLSDDGATVLSDRSFSGRRGLVHRIGERWAPGTKIIVHRRRRHRAAERREVAFYCRCSEVPVIFNGKKLKRVPVGSVDASQTLLRLDYRTDTGHGVMGLPKRGSMSRTRYYKHGIYFGVRQVMPSDHLPIESSYNSLTSDFEENFRASVKAAGVALRAGREALLEYIPEQYPELGKRERERVRSVLLGMAERRWTPELRRLPLFDTGARPACLSLDDIEVASRARGFVAWAARDDASRFGPRSRLPLLDEGEADALHRVLGLPLRRALRAPGLSPDLPRGERRAGTTLSDDAVAPPLQRLVKGLRRIAPQTVFVMVAGGDRFVDDESGTPIVHLPIDDPLVQRCAATLEKDPSRIDVVRACLCG